MAAFVQVDLSRYPSDGSVLNWPTGNRYSLASAADEDRFLRRLSEVASAGRAHGTPRVHFTSLPSGYRVIKKTRTDTTTRGRDFHLYGHSKGHFKSAPKAWVHVWSIMSRNLANCGCDRCRVRVQAAG